MPCKSARNAEENVAADMSSKYVEFSSFQNPDSTWGFTVFVNSRPFILMNKVKLKKASSWFLTEGDPDKVAKFFVMIIKERNSAPELNSKLIDSLEIKF